MKCNVGARLLFLAAPAAAVSWRELWDWCRAANASWDLFCSMRMNVAVFIVFIVLLLGDIRFWVCEKSNIPFCFTPRPRLSLAIVVQLFV